MGFQSQRTELHPGKPVPPGGVLPVPPIITPSIPPATPDATTTVTAEPTTSFPFDRIDIDGDTDTDYIGIRQPNGVLELTAVPRHAPWWERLLPVIITGVLSVIGTIAAWAIAKSRE